MADVTLKGTTRQTTAAGIAGLFGLFAGLCAIFAGGVTLIDWYTETTQARWPVVAAIVERADLVASRRTSKDGGGELWRLTTRVRYDVNGEARTATLTSRSAYSDEEYLRLQAWTVQHRKGSYIDIRFDPSRPNRAVFAAAEPGFGSGGIRDDLILFAIAAIACPGLLALARYLGSRAARASPVAEDPQRGGPVLGSLFAVPGLAMLGSAIYGVAHNAPFKADDWIGVLIAVMFVLAGIYVGVPPQYRRLRNVLSALVVTCFALTFDGVAFGPGERHFTGSIGGIGFIPGEMMGRIVFGIFAVVLDICAIAVWVRLCRQMIATGDSATNRADSAA
jgi:hypothetical protein